jgi:phosphoglycolate phosphatase-like HAD superfamily hydrolase
MNSLPSFPKPWAVLLLVALASGMVVSAAKAQDPLPSWNEGDAKAAIIGFVAAVTDKSNKDYVPPAERIATFDNDGTLWVEAPLYTQVMFAFARVKAMAPDHPEWKDKPALKAVMDGDLKAVARAGKKGLVEILKITHAGMTTEEFAKTVSDWIASAEHPKLKRKYTDLTYQPMKELIAYLQDNDFKTYIVSGGGVEFMRPWTKQAYGIAPEHVIGSSVVTEFRMKDGKPVLVRQPKVFFIDDKEGKAIAIQKFIGRRPIASFGNADADIPMIQWTLAGHRRRLGMIVHHTDAEREFAYDRKSIVGTLDKGIDRAQKGGWHLIDMAKDWKSVFAEQ